MRSRKPLNLIVFTVLLLGAVPAAIGAAPAAPLAAPAARPSPKIDAGLPDQLATQHANLYSSLNCILLVDDDGDNQAGNPDVRSYYTAALDALDLDYDIWDVATAGDPDFGVLREYGTVLWFTGFSAWYPFNAANEAAVADYLNVGGRFFLSSQDYFYGPGLTPFAQEYLHVASYQEEVHQWNVTGQNVFAGLGFYALDYPFPDMSDAIIPDAAAQVAFMGYVQSAAISYDGGDFRTIFFGYPFEALPVEGRIAVMQRIIEWFGTCRRDIDVTPPALSEELCHDQIATQPITICNTGAQPLTWSADDAIGPARDVLLLIADYEADDIRASLLAYGDLSAIDVYNAAVSTPALAELLPYDLVVTWSGIPYADPVGAGDVLADYVDAGGKVANLVGSFGTWGGQMQGRFIDQGYTAMNGAGLAGTGSCLGSYDPSHPIMAGVTEVCDLYRISGTYLTPGSAAVADWADGAHLVAAKDDRTVVTINGNVGSIHQWSGQMPDVVHNTILWLLDVPWLSESPASGTLPVAGSCTSVTVTFSSADLSPADYSGALLVLSNDPDESWLSVPVSLTVLAPLSGVDFDWSPPDPVIGQTVLFSATVAAGEPPIDYSWNWGDGTTGSGQYAAHTFIALGTYTVTLTAINACGQAVVQHQVAVAGLPDIDITAPPLETALCPDATDASVVTICNAGTALLTWSLSENPAVDWLSENPGSGSLLPAGCADVDVTFDAAGLVPGDYSADLLVISNDPDEPQLALQASLAVLAPVGDLVLQFSPPDPVVGETIYFTGTVTAGDPPLTYAWTWGDGTAPGSGQYATHAYAAAGDYLVVLTVSNACGPAQAEWTVTARQGGLYVVYLPVVVRSYP